MRKIVRSALTVAVSIAALGGLYSCKDSNEDLIYSKYAELSQQLENLRNELLNNDTAIETALQSQITGINSLISGLQGEVSTLQGEIATINSKIANLKDCDCESTTSTINNYITNINNQIDKLQDDVKDATDALAGLNGKPVDEAIADAIANNNEDIKSLLANYVTLNELKETLAEQLANYATNERVDGLETEITNLKNSFGNYYTKAEINGLLAGLQTDIDAAQTTATAAQTKAGEAYDKAAEAYAKALAAYTLAEDNQSDITDIKARLDEAEKNLADAKETLHNEIEAAKTELAKNIGELKSAYEAADAKLQEQIDDLNERVSANEAAITALRNELANLVTGVLVQGTFNTPFGSLALPLNIQSNILCAYYGQTESAVEFPSTKTANLVDATKALTSADFAVLGVAEGQVKLSDGQMIVKDSENNAGKIYLTVNPTGIDYKGLSISLENSVGEASPIKLSPLTPSNDKLTFGYTGSRSEANGFYVANAHVDVADLAKAKINIESGLKSAVKDVYQNKTAANFTNLASLVYKQFNGILDANAVKVTRADGNSLYSQYGVAAFAFKPLSFAFNPSLSYSIPTLDFDIPSLDDIKFDFDLADLNFDFNFDVNFDLNFNLDDFKIEIGEIELGSIDLSGVNPSVEVSFTYQYPKFYKDSETGEYLIEQDADGEMVMEDKEGHTTVDLTNFMGDLSKEMGDAINEQINEAISSMIADLNTSLKDQIQTQLLDQLSSKLNEQIAGQINEQINNLATDLNSSINDLLGDLSSQINDQVSSSLSGYQTYLDKLQTVVDRVNNIINRVNNVNVFSKIHTALQGVLIYQDNNGKFGRVSATKSAPSVFKVKNGNAIVLHPTSLTAEILAPAYKKFVGVTNVWSNNSNASAQGGDQGCLAAAKKANSQNYFDEVIEGSRYGVPFVAEAGYTYEIVYSALDYQGKVSQRKFYIKVI